MFEKQALGFKRLNESITSTFTHTISRTKLWRLCSPKSCLKLNLNQIDSTVGKKRPEKHGNGNTCSFKATLTSPTRQHHRFSGGFVSSNPNLILANLTILWSTLRKVHHSQFQSAISKGWFIVRPLSSVSTFSCTYGHPVAAYVFFLHFLSLFP
jgi:hypothetical protein